MTAENPSEPPPTVHLAGESNDGEAILRQLVGGLQEIVQFHQDVVGDAWAIAGSLTGLHADVLGRLSRAIGNDWSDAEQGVLLLGSHAFNVFTAAVGATCRGEFDTIQYLTRAAHDAASLVTVCAISDSHSERWLRGELKASEARRDFVQVLSDAGHVDEAADLDKLLREEAEAANVAAHLGPLHADRLIRKDEDGVLWPTIGGRSDSRLALRQIEMSLALEITTLSPLLSSFVQPSEPSELDRFTELHERLRVWRSELLER